MTEALAAACYCGTCSSCADSAPRPVVADPAIFRHGAIRERLLGHIGAVEIELARPLAKLGTRDTDDPAIALIDAYAGSLHILAWNTARLWDDGTLTRTEDREALVRLTRLLGYEPRPALAATTTLAFTVETREGSPLKSTIPKGSKVASVPAQNELPQIFETDVALEARAEWNALKPVQTRIIPSISTSTGVITIAGVSTTAKVGDQVLVYLEPQGATKKWLCARVTSVIRQAENPDLKTPAQTRLTLAGRYEVDAPTGLQGADFRNRVIVLGQKATPFGANAPDPTLFSEPPRNSISDVADATTGRREWKGLTMGSVVVDSVNQVDLDAVYADAAPGRVALFNSITGTPAPALTVINAVFEGSRSGFGLSAKVSRIGAPGISFAVAAANNETTTWSNKVRSTTISLETVRETLLVVDADTMVPAGVATDRITVEGQVALPVGRRLVLSGDTWATGGGRLTEVVILKSSTIGVGETLLVFEKAIVGRYHSATLLLLANTVGASHGVTPANGAELIGSGDASIPSPRFALKGSPLAYVPSANARGYAPAIEVRVGDRLYEERASLFCLAGEARAYTVRQVGDEVSEVQFAGRLPSGLHNVSALYRTGGGRAGNMPAGRVTTAMEPVVGIGGVANVVAAEGGSDAETLEDMRASAPQSIRTLDRVVSLSDFEVFASRYRGVGKALASEMHSGMRLVICITIATTDMSTPVAGADIFEALGKALKSACAPGRSIRIAGFRSVKVTVTIRLAIDPVFRRADIEAQVREALRTRFAPSAIRFARALHRSAVLAAAQGVEGVIAASIASFTRPGALETEGRLMADGPVLSGATLLGAELLYIEPSEVQFVEMTP